MLREMQKKIGFVLVLSAVVLMAGCSTEKDVKQIELTEVEETQEKVQEAEDAGEEDIYVHVCGEVIRPGVYRLPAGSRVYEAIEAAGGLSQEAHADSLNQAARAEDGQQVYVPSMEEAAKNENSFSGAEGLPADDGKVNLNTASAEQLMTLNGIGEAKAAAIIRYREEHGAFQSTEELMEVEGIKEGTWNKIKDQIKI